MNAAKVIVGIALASVGASVFVTACATFGGGQFWNVFFVVWMAFCSAGWGIALLKSAGNIK